MKIEKFDITSLDDDVFIGNLSQKFPLRGHHQYSGSGYVNVIEIDFPYSNMIKENFEDKMIQRYNSIIDQQVLDNQGFNTPYTDPDFLEKITPLYHFALCIIGICPNPSSYGRTDDKKAITNKGMLCRSLCTLIRQNAPDVSSVKWRVHSSKPACLTHHSLVSRYLLLKRKVKRFHIRVRSVTKRGVCRLVLLTRSNSTPQQGRRSFKTRHAWDVRCARFLVRSAPSITLWRPARLRSVTCAVEIQLARKRVQPTQLLSLTQTGLV
jgi:hypothetical protein